MINTAVILAVGSNTHQSQLSYTRPRTMLPALGKPMVVRVMDRLHRIGVENYIVVLGEKEGSITSYLNTRWLPKVNIEFTLKLEHQPLGRVLSAIAQNHSSPFLIAGYNSFTHSNFPERISRYHLASPDDLILSGTSHTLSRAEHHFYAWVAEASTTEIMLEGQNPAEVVSSIQPHLSDRYQNLLLADLAVCGNGFIHYLKTMNEASQRSAGLNTLFKNYLESGGTTRVARTSWVLQVETDSDLLTLNHHLLDEKLDSNILSEIPKTVQIREPVRIDPGVSIGQDAIIGPYVYLETGSSVGHNAQVRNAIVLERGVVGSKEIVEDCILSSRGRLTS
ncbi:MAG: sugar phosphate nucleotidyltransferase [Phototrophicaceae bacterium]